MVIFQKFYLIFVKSKSKSTIKNKKSPTLVLVPNCFFNNTAHMGTFPQSNKWRTVCSRISIHNRISIDNRISADNRIASDIKISIYNRISIKNRISINNSNF